MNELTSGNKKNTATDITTGDNQHRDRAPSQARLTAKGPVDKIRAISVRSDGLQLFARSALLFHTE